MASTIPAQFSLGEGLGIRMHVGSAVDFTHEPPLRFKGAIEKIHFKLGKADVGKPQATAGGGREPAVARDRRR